MKYYPFNCISQKAKILTVALLFEPYKPFLTVRYDLNSGQPSTGVELRKKMNDDFQDFIDFVDPIIKNPLASNEGKLQQ